MVEEDTSLYSKMVRKVKLIYVDLLLYWLENFPPPPPPPPEKRRFPWLESHNKLSLAETWLIRYKIKSWKINVAQKTVYL